MTKQTKFEAAKVAYFGFFRNLPTGPISAANQTQIELRRAEMIAAYDAVKRD